MSFKAAFAAARKAGKKEFTWNGKLYNTKIKEEVAPPRRPSSPRPKARPDSKPSVMSEAPKQPKAPPSPAPIVRGGSKPAPKPAAAPAKPAAKPAARGGISDWGRANKGKPAPKTKGPSVRDVARAIEFQGSGYLDVLRGGPRNPPKKQAAAPRKKGGWGDK